MKLLRLLSIYMLITVSLTSVSFAALDPAKEDTNEIKLGQDASVQIDKDLKLIKSGEEVDRVNRIGAKLAVVVNSINIPAIWGINRLSQFNYTFKVVDSPDINAFSLPGGFIYVNKGLIAACQSDHELAGVMAHELGHAAHHHRVYIMNQINHETRGISGLVQVLAAAAMMSKNVDAARGLLTGVNAYETSIESKYSVEAEVDADNAAVYYMMKSGYNPVGLYSFMSRLASDEMRRPSVNWGIMETHPPSQERARKMLVLFEKNNIPVNRRDVATVLGVTVKEDDVAGRKVSTLLIDGAPVAKLADREGEPGTDRVKKAQDAMDMSLTDNTRVQDVVVGTDKKSVYIAERKVLVFTPEDEALNSKSPILLASDAVTAIRKAIWKTKIDR